MTTLAPERIPSSLPRGWMVPRAVVAGSSTSGSAAYTLEYYNSLLRIYRGSSTSGSPMAVIEDWDELPKPMLMFLLVLLGE